MKLSLSGWLLLGLIGMTLAAGFTTTRWLTARANCRTQMEAAARIAVEQERTRAGKADQKAQALFEEVREVVRGAVEEAAQSTASRDTAIDQVKVTGDCVMPKGLPSLAPAVKEARDAAKD